MDFSENFILFFISLPYLAAAFSAFLASSRHDGLFDALAGFLALSAALAHVAFLLYLVFAATDFSRPTYYLVLLMLSLVAAVPFFPIARSRSLKPYAPVFPAFSFFLIYLAKVFSEDSLFGAGDAYRFAGLLDFGRLAHVVGVVAGSLFLSISFFLSVVFLFRERRFKQKKIDLDKENPGLGKLIKSIHKSNLSGFVLLSLGLLMGVVVGRTSPESPGVLTTAVRYVIPLAAWLVYGFLIVNASIVGLRGKVLARFSVLGFAAVASAFLIEVAILKLA